MLKSCCQQIVTEEKKKKEEEEEEKARDRSVPDGSDNNSTLGSVVPLAMF